MKTNNVFTASGIMNINPDANYKSSFSTTDELISSLKNAIGGSISVSSNSFKNSSKTVPELDSISVEANNTTVVRWKDKTVTVVRCSENDNFDVYSAFCAALAKRIYGTTSAVYRMIDKKNVETVNRKKEEAKQKAAEERKEREKINHDRKIRRLAKELREMEEAYAYLADTCDEKCSDESPDKE